MSPAAPVSEVVDGFNFSSFCEGVRRFEEAKEECVIYLPHVKVSDGLVRGKWNTCGITCGYKSGACGRWKMDVDVDEKE